MKNYLFIGFLFINLNLFATNYYVNDNSQVNDRFTSAVGTTKNDGLSPSTPKNSILEVYQLAQTGDVIYVDFGSYPELNEKGILTFENTKQVVIKFYFDYSIIQEKTEIPSHLKTNPEEFYIINDKPVDRTTYLLWLQSTSNTKK